MAAPRVYVDATPLIALARIGRLDLLTEASSTVYVTRGVWREVTGDANKTGVADLLRAQETGIIEVVAEGDATDFPQLGAGEAETLSAARTVRHGPTAVLVDEARARELLRSDPTLAHVGMLGTVGLVVRAKRRGSIPSAQAILDDLRRANFYQTRQLYEDALRAAGEWPPSRP